MVTPEVGWVKDSIRGEKGNLKEKAFDNIMVLYLPLCILLVWVDK